MVLLRGVEPPTYWLRNLAINFVFI